MRPSLLLVLLAAMIVGRPSPAFGQDELFGCPQGDQDVEFKRVKAKALHPKGLPSEGKAVVYFIARKPGTAIVGRHSFALNGTLLARAPHNTYSRFEVDPGLLRLCYWAMHSRGKLTMYLTAEAGKSYYLLGWWQNFVEISPQEAEQFLRKFDYCDFKPRQVRQVG